MLNFAGIVDNSTIDYPGKLCAVVYLCGCPLRCPWCHNKNILNNDPNFCKKVSIQTIVNKINKNYLVEAVCLTGGEPLMSKESINLILELKKTGKLVKLDTNLCYPDSLDSIIGVLDFISVDIKTSLDRYSEVTGVSDPKIVNNIKESLNILKRSKLPKEARTTIVPKLNDKKEIIEQICKDIKDIGFDYYTLQQFRGKNTLDPKYEGVKGLSREEMMKLGTIAKKLLPGVKIRISTLEKGIEEIDI